MSAICRKSNRNEEGLEGKGQAKEGENNTVNAKEIARYFLGFWNAKQAYEALKHLEALETRSHVRRLQKKYGYWHPPPEVVDALKKPPAKTNSSILPNNKDTRNLRFVLKMLGCSLRHDRPYREFLKAESNRQKRKWLYKYQGPLRPTRPEVYNEPICATRLRRLYHFFPDRFRHEEDNVFFNNQLLTYDEAKRLFYIGVVPVVGHDVHDDYGDD